MTKTKPVILRLYRDIIKLASQTFIKTDPQAAALFADQQRSHFKKLKVEQRHKKVKLFLDEKKKLLKWLNDPRTLSKIIGDIYF